MASQHPWQFHIRVKRSDRRPFVLILDSILVYVNEFVSISELTQSRKDKINSNDITERFLLSLFGKSFMSQIVERVRTIKLFYI